ncbi:UvrD-helicase domain-containing protein [Fulvivirgaceae bacterium BMA12]|uniref:UvrD-helicase domain-containing protein n=1 Tax=Agaribacillus aureus TaxID=3051825 RepID=A0ABT8L9R9_9BACT|nr:UvrD-helicase domain-containing protein [Fulvivirgaceae bacterium BMA12]
MFYIADLHVHSHYSRATSKDLNLESLYQWAKIKGINVVGTGDFTHPQWFQELKDKLVPDGSGFFKLKNPPKTPAIPGLKVAETDVRFCLTTEISSIYKYGDKVRKNHNLLYAPDLETVARLNAKLSGIGNLEADGRPILGLPSHDLLHIALETSEKMHLIPAHVWTPWFSTLGSKGGYDSVGECFRDLTDHIFALETGLSSDPAMNWKWSDLDRYTLVSNSDAHSPQKLGREANLFDTELSYEAMFNAIKTKQGFLGTYEFFPEEGKYHLDGHRNCGIVLEPEATSQYKGLCPKCNRPLTVGVLHRVEKLADRTLPQKPEGAADFDYIIPLPEILGEIENVGPSSKTVLKAFHKAISTFGNEFTLLKQVPVEDIERYGGPVIAEAIRRMRQQEVKAVSGYDGVYGVIRVFNEGEIEKLQGQLNFFGSAAIKPMAQREVKPSNLSDHEKETDALPSPTLLNDEQLSVRESTSGAVLVKAGPGTGKTSTLIHWIASQINEKGGDSGEIMALTFTNKAADEMKERLITLLGDKTRGITIGTFHATAYQLLQEKYPNLNTVYSNDSRQLVLDILFPQLTATQIKKLNQALVRYFELGEESGFENIAEYASKYRMYVHKRGAIDLSDIMAHLLQLWKKEPKWLEYARSRYKAMAIDEFQDINALQNEFIRQLGKEKSLLAIGDPDQSIYGFRGSDLKLFFKFKEAFAAREITLFHNYRSAGNIVEAGTNLIQNNSLKSGLKLKAHKAMGKKIKLCRAGDTAKEAKYLVKEIEKYVGGTENLTIGTPAEHGAYAFSDIAMLFRTKVVGNEILKELRKSGIPAHFGDNTSFLSDPPFTLIADILRLYLNTHDLVALNGVLTNGFGWGKKDVKALLNVLHESGHNWVEQSSSIFKASLHQDWRQWQEFFRSLPDAFQPNGVAGAVRLIFEQYLPDSKLNDAELLKKEAILNLAAECQADVQNFLDKMILNPYTDVGRLSTEGVHLLTFHAAKGLEFPVVFIVGAEEGITPLQREGADPEEERRLFYVAITRAKEELQICHVANRKLYGETKSMAPSSFIKEIPAHLFDRIQSPEKKVNKEAQLRISY